MSAHAVAAPREQAAPELGSTALRRLVRRPMFVAAALIIVVVVAMAAVPAAFTSQDPEACGLNRSLQSPSGAHWLGTDLQGCDVYARAVHGARASVLVGVLVTLATTILGGAVGALAGYHGGWVDTVLSRVGEIFLAIPLLLGATILLSTVAGGEGGLLGVVAALTVYGWAQIARIMRSSVLSVRGLGYVTAARALGATDARILLRHVVPNAIGPVLVMATTNLGLFITFEATISFLGLGLQPPTISWGQSINDAQARFLDAPFPLLGPAGFLSLTVLGFILLGDAVRDALDPRSDQ